MNAAAVAFFVSVLNAHFFAQSEPSNPPVIAKMEELGTVYLTRYDPTGKPPSKLKKGAIIGVDFRPTAGTDPKKIAAVVKEFSTLPDLQTILLLGQDVTDEAVDALPKSAKITSIQFFRTQVSDKGIAKLSRLTNLQVFKFTGMTISDQAMRELAKIKTVHTIVVTDSKITDAGIMALHMLPNLQELVVENTAVTQQGIDQLRERLPRIERQRILR